MPPPLSAYLRLMRFDKPTGIWLLMWPGWWAATLAAGEPPWAILALFFVGAAAMRAAGCVVNDLIDRDIDRQVARTRGRPLASGEVSTGEALVLLGFLLTVACAVAVTLGPFVVFLASLWLLPVAVYPFMKRVTWWPQFFLGLTFSAGAILGWTAARGGVELPALLLYVGATCWTLGYDTIYAYQDAPDDARVGVKSTALRFGARGKAWIVGFYGAFVLALAGAGFFAAASPVYYLLLLPVAAQLAAQVARVDLAAPERCLAAFRSNAWTGGLVWLACVFGATPS